MNEIPMKSVAWKIGELNIPFFIGHDCPDAIAAALGAFDADRLVVVADSAMWDLHRDRYEPAFTRVSHLRAVPWSCAENEKSLGGVESLSRTLLSEGVTRRSILIAAGGGALGNLTGLTAALLFRGIRFIHVPTTLLAMHDSVTSLKQGVNAGGIKNILGVYHVPTAIFVDTAFIGTLPAAHIRSGMTELVKNALILGGDYAQAMATELRREKSPAIWAGLIEAGVAAKAGLMRDDPHERGAALALEYGHTIGPRHRIGLRRGIESRREHCLGNAGRCLDRTRFRVNERRGLSASRAMGGVMGLADFRGRGAGYRWRMLAAGLGRTISAVTFQSAAVRWRWCFCGEPGVVVKTDGMPLIGVGLGVIDKALRHITL